MLGDERSETKRGVTVTSILRVTARYIYYMPYNLRGRGLAIRSCPDYGRKTARKKSRLMAPVSTERDLRLDLFRGIALWLIFLDHIPSNAVSWITIRNYGFSDATEIFVFISGYTAAFVYGRAMREHGFIVASARVLKRAWQIYVAHVFLFAIYLAEISYVAHELRQSALQRGNGRARFPQAIRTSPSFRRCC